MVNLLPLVMVESMLFLRQTTSPQRKLILTQTRMMVFWDISESLHSNPQKYHSAGSTGGSLFVVPHGDSKGGIGHRNNHLY